MRVNIWLVITILAIEVTSSMATTRSVEAALEKQLNKKGYAVLQLKKKRLVLRDTEDNDIKKHDSNQSHHKKSISHESIPADKALRNKYIDTSIMKKFAGTNLSANNRQRRQKGESDDYLQKAEQDDLDSMEKSFKAGANDLAAALEAEEVREIAHPEHGTIHIVHDNGIQQSQSNAIESDDKYNSNYEVYDNKQEIEISDQWNFSADKDAENHSGNRESLEAREKNEKTQTSGKDTKSGNLAEIAKDVGTVLELLTKGEKKLLDEMEEIKSALEKSITTLQNAETEMIVKRKRRDAWANKKLSEVMSSLTKEDIVELLARSKRENLEGPSRACVFIDAPVTSNVAATATDFHQDQSQRYSSNVAWNSNSGQGEQFGQYQVSYNSVGNGDSSAGDQRKGYSHSIAQSNSEDMKSRVSSDDINHEHFQSSISSMTNSVDDSNQQSEYGTQSIGESIDLHSIYWLKLPTEYNDSFDEKVYSLLKGITHTGRDILIIPVTRSYQNSDDITDGFLRAVRVSPSSQRAQYFKNVRQLNIQRMI